MDMLEVFNAEIPKVGEAVQNFPWSDPKYYIQFLSQTYYYVKHSTPLLGRALRKMDTSTPVVKDRFLEHTKEEKGHQYLIVDDLKMFGLTTESIPEHSETTEFYKIQYDYINKYGSTSLFGYILQLEGTAWKYGDPICATLKETFGEGAANFMNVHSGGEIEHVNRAFEMIRSFKAEEIEIVRENFLKSCQAYVNLIGRAKREGDKNLIKFTKP